jgi:Right handed beta helix region
MRRFLRLVAVLFTFAALVVPGSSAAITAPQCGDVITTDVVLNKNLFCSGDGLTIPGFVNVTLDLHGHSIVGSGVGSGIRILSSLNPDASSSSPAAVTVENGSVRAFESGVSIEPEFGLGIANLVLTRLVIRGNDTGVVDCCVGRAAVVLSDSTVSGNHANGVSVGFVSRRFRMINDKVTSNGGDGIFAFEDSLSLLQDSFIGNNGGAGARLTNTVAVISGNTFDGNGGTGLSIVEQLCPIFPFYAVSDNVANRNGGGGISMAPFLPCDPPVAPPPGSGNAAKHNAGFQCVLIVCAANRGQAKKTTPRSDASLPVQSR